VLVVDDNACARELLADMCTSLRFDIDTAADGHTALNMAQRADADDKPYDLVLLDWKMPGLDGIECARLLDLENRRHAAPTVLMVTAFSRDEAQLRLAQRQVSVGALLTKPVTPSTLLDACSEALGLGPPRAPRAKRRQEALSGHQARLRGAQILLVEDNPINREIALSVLGSADIVVSVACDGREALQMLARQRFDGVLMDCQMPVMDGYEATRALRQQPQWHELPVIAMTANALVGDRDKVLAAGMNDHVAKPINVDELFATLARWIRPPVAAPDELPAIDRQAGITSTMGNEDLYLRLMRMFRDRETNFGQRFRAARATGEMAAAMRMAHDLKNVAGTLAVRAVHHAAEQLERACLDEVDDEGIEPLLRNVERLLRPVMAELLALD